MDMDHIFYYLHKYRAWEGIYTAPIYIVFYIFVFKMLNFWDYIIIENILKIKNNPSHLSPEEHERIQYTYYREIVHNQ